PPLGREAEQQADALQRVSELSAPAGLAHEPGPLPDAEERGDGPDRNERRPRDREGESRLPLTLGKQRDRRGAGSRRERRMLEGVERQDAHLALPLRSAATKNLAVQRTAALGEKRAEADCDDARRLLPADPRTALDVRDRPVGE